MWYDKDNDKRKGDPYMQITVSHPTYGLITYEESFWTGKKTILFDGVPLVKLSKNTFQIPSDGTTPPVTMTVKGSYLGGLTLFTPDEVITVTGKPTVADYVLGILPGALFFGLIMQGAIGGALAGMMGFGGVMLMKTRPNLKQKLLISLGASAAIIALGIAIVVAVMSQMTN
jgi:hypothetical protein